MVERGEHAVAFATDERDSVLLGFALEGLQSSDRVVIATCAASPRAIDARLRAAGVGASMHHPGELRVVRCAGGPRCVLRNLAWLTHAARIDGYEGLHLAHLCAPESLPGLQADEDALPRRIARNATVLCVYDRDALERVGPDAWSLARWHARILCV
jgi:hypothetical protein